MSTPISPKITTPATPNLPGGRRIRTSGLGSSKKLRQPFKSPLHARQSSTPTDNNVCSKEGLESLRQKLQELDDEIQDLRQEYEEGELQLHIDKLHEYNEIKDAGQLLMGKLGELEGKTTKCLYAEFGLNIED